ncbi:MAG: ATPase [Cycloclasticus sp. symbiont of Poecilosclerida sp. M]|nr:MAG: ATPase [Cycloclasticus sp. symbiont of Poecilosclerida sp. M]
MKRSIHFRLLVSASLVLFFFLSIAGVIIDMAYKQGAEGALQQRLQIRLYSILGTAELSKNNQLMLPNGLSEPAFSQTGSGLHAYIFKKNGELVWRSSSSVGYPLKPIGSLVAGEREFREHQDGDSSFMELYYEAVLENKFGNTEPFEFAIVESTDEVNSQLTAFRSVLWQWLGGIGLLLIIIQYFVLRHSLKPLRHIVADLEKIQHGERQKLGTHYSDELKDIANTLNRLIDNERTHLKRYRNTLADLAHSLKTPLSVLTGLHQQTSLKPDDIKTLEQQTSMMRQLVDYQLQRAAAKGHQTLTIALHIAPIFVQLTDSLNKVYVDKQLNVVLDLDENIKFYAEKGDLFELLGNLLDNAYKWANKQVHIGLSASSSTESTGVRITIEDDGPGISKNELSEVLKRGIRADETTKGHGIGLAVVNELVSLYKGSMTAEISPLGGHKWLIALPGQVEHG